MNKQIEEEVLYEQYQSKPMDANRNWENTI